MLKPEGPHPRDLEIKGLCGSLVAQTTVAGCQSFYLIRMKRRYWISQSQAFRVPATLGHTQSELELVYPTNEDRSRMNFEMQHCNSRMHSEPCHEIPCQPINTKNSCMEYDNRFAIVQRRSCEGRSCIRSSLRHSLLSQSWSVAVRSTEPRAPTGAG